MKVEQENKIAIPLKNGKTAVLKFQEFNNEFDIDEILRIDYGNIMGEILTFPLVFNRVANMKADIESLVAECKLDFEVFEAQLTEEKRKTLESSGKKVTIAEVEAAVKLDVRYSIKRKEYLDMVKKSSYLDSLYWSAQSKDTKLNRLSEKLRPEEFERELIEDSINGVMVKFTKNLIN